MRPARGETNFGGGSEGERFLRRWSAVFGLCAESEQTVRAHAAGVFASLSSFPKCSAVGMEQRPGAPSLSWSCASGCGGMERSRSVGKAGESRAYGGQARVTSSAVACHDLAKAAVATGEQEARDACRPGGNIVDYSAVCVGHRALAVCALAVGAKLA